MSSQSTSLKIERGPDPPDPPAEKLENKIEATLAEILGAVYSRVDWKKTARGRVPTDVFQHRLRCASCQSTVRRVLEKLCRGLGLQSVPVDPEKIDFLEENKDTVLEKLREESVYWTLRAQLWARQKRKQKTATDKNSVKHRETGVR